MRNTIRPHHTDKILTQILEAVVKFYRITEEQLKSSYRGGYCPEARQMFCYMGKDQTVATLDEIGVYINKTHCMVHYGIKKVKYDIHSNRRKTLHAIEYIKSCMEMTREDMQIADIDRQIAMLYERRATLLAQNEMALTA